MGNLQIRNKNLKTEGFTAESAKLAETKTASQVRVPQAEPSGKPDQLSTSLDPEPAQKLSAVVANGYLAYA